MDPGVVAISPARAQAAPIPARLRDRVDNELLRMFRASEAASTNRNERFRDFDDQLRGDPYWTGMKPRWRGASEIDDNLTRDHHLGMVANFLAVLRSEQWWTAKATVEEDEQDAADFEAFLNDQISRYDLAQNIGYKLAYNAGRHTYAILYCGWKQTYKTLYRTMYKQKGSNTLIEPEERITGNRYVMVEVDSQDVEEDGLDFRVPYTGDVWFDPPDVQSVEQAERIYEQMYISASDLLDGIDDFGYDKAAVKAIIAQASVTDTDERTRDRNSVDGTQQAATSRMYRCIMCVGRPPLILNDGESLLKKETRRRDYLWMFCPSAGVVFKCDPLPFEERPYIKFDFLEEPGRMMGDGVTTLAQSYHLESTIAARFRIDGRDIAMTPTLRVPEAFYDDWEHLKIGPGMWLPYSKEEGPEAISPLPYDKSFFGAALQDSNDLRMRAAQLFSADARGVTTTNERTATEVSNASAGADAKFDLFLSCFHVGIRRLAEVITSHYRQFSPEGDILTGSRVVKLTPDLLAKKFRVSAHGSSLETNPQARMERAKAIYEFMMTNPLVQQAVMKGDMTGVWAISATILRCLEVRDPPSIIGKEPMAPPGAEFILEQLAGAIQQFAQAGDPGAVQLMQMLMQMQASQPQGGGAQQGPPPPKESINFKDVPDWAQTQMLAQAGIKPPQGQQQMIGAH